jgi:hypothetical protein
MDVDPSPGDPTAPFDPSGEQARLDTERRTAELLEQLKVDAAQDGSDRIAAIEEAKLADAQRRAAQRQLELTTELENRNITLEQFHEAEKQNVQALENDKNAIRSEAVARSIQITASALTLTEGMLKDFQTLAGNKSKELFIAQKAVSVALTLIKTYEAAQSAYATGNKISPTLGAVMAGIAVAQGLARVAIIRQQTLAAGGMVEGHSPHSAADNIQIAATAGEFVHPVKTVQYYGTGVMEAMRQRAIDRGVLASAALPGPPPSRRFAFQSGGQIARGTRIATEAAQQTRQPINITNIVDKEQIDQHLATRPGEEAVLNVLAKNAFQVRQILAE